MADDRTFEYEADQQNLKGDAIISLYTLDIKPADEDVPDAERYFRFVNWVESDGVQVKYDGENYTPIPLKTNGFNIKTEGVPPNPTIQVGNIGLEFTGLVNKWNDLVGAEIKIRKILAKHLDNGSSPDVDEHWPDETWTIEQKQEENKLFVTFSLATAFDLDGCMLPKRRALRYTCPWKYRSADCSYTGPPIADNENNLLTSDSDATIQDLYDKRVAWENAQAATETALTAYTDAQAVTENERELYNSTTEVVETKYERETAPLSYSSSDGTNLWEDATVTLGPNSFQRGALKETVSGVQYYEIQSLKKESRDDLDAAEAAEAAAKTTYDNAVIAEATAKTAYDDAVTAWQGLADPPSDADDVCAKNIAACRLRFPTEALPFGGFPGLTLDL